jgi:hypothetical protein
MSTKKAAMKIFETSVLPPMEMLLDRTLVKEPL